MSKQDDDNNNNNNELTHLLSSSTAPTNASNDTNTTEQDRFEGGEEEGGYHHHHHHDGTDETALEVVVEGIVEEFQTIREAFEEHVQEVEDVDDFFLDIGITRGMSLLPTKDDMNEVAADFGMLATPHHPHAHHAHHAHPAITTTASAAGDAAEHGEQVIMETIMMETIPVSTVIVVEKTIDEDEVSMFPAVVEPLGTPISAYVGLVGAVLALSCIGPFLDALEGVDPAMKVVWRSSGTALFLSPFAFRSMRRDNGAGYPTLTIPQWCAFFLAAGFYCVLTVGYAIALQYTSVGNATILSNSQSILLIVAKALTGRDIVAWEGIGVAVAFSGAVLCSRDSAHQPHKIENGKLSAWGDILALLSALGGIGYITLGKSLRKELNAVVFMFMIMTTIPCMTSLYMVFMGKEITLDRHVDHGIFGWMTAERFPLELAVVGICNVFGTMGYIRSFQYFSAVHLSVAALMEPVAATVIAVILQVGTFPGMEGWIGNVMVIFGTLSVMYPTFKGGGEAHSH